MYVTAAYGDMLLRVDVDVNAEPESEQADNAFFEPEDQPTFLVHEIVAFVNETISDPL